MGYEPQIKQNRPSTSSFTGATTHFETIHLKNIEKFRGKPLQGILRAKSSLKKVRESSIKPNITSEYIDESIMESVRPASVIYNDEIKITGMHQSDKNSMGEVTVSQYHGEVIAPPDINSEYKFDNQMYQYEKMLKVMKDRDTK